MTNRSGWIGLLAVAVLATTAGVASAQFSLQDNAYLVTDPQEGTVVEITSVTGFNWPNPLYGGAWIYEPAAEIPFNDLATIAYKYNVMTAAGGGSPRIVVGIDHFGVNRYLSIYLGPLPNFVSGPTGWITETNLLDDPDLRFDTLQFPGGTFYDSYVHAAALIQNQPVFGVWFAVDGGWTGTTQQIRFDEFSINGVTADAKFVIETRDPGEMDDLEDAVILAKALTDPLVGNAYVTLGKTSEDQAYAAHQKSKGVGYFTQDDFPGALLTYKAFRYQQYKYHLRARQYLNFGGAGAAAAAIANQTAGQLGNMDYNNP